MSEKLKRWEIEAKKAEAERLIDSLLARHDTKIRRENDASNCRTRHDWDKFHEAQDAFESLKEETLRAIVGMFEG